MAPEYISKINKIRKLMKISILIYFFGEGVGGGVGCSFLFSNQTWFLHFVIYFTRLVRRYIYMYLRTASSCIIHGVFKCLVKSTFSVWLSSANNQKRGRIFGHRHYTKKILFVRINVDISSVLTNAGRRFVPCIKHLWCFKLHIICLLLLWLNYMLQRWTTSFFFSWCMVFTIHVQTAHFKIHVAYMQCQIALSSKPIVL